MVSTHGPNATAARPENYADDLGGFSNGSPRFLVAGFCTRLTSITRFTRLAGTTLRPATPVARRERTPSNLLDEFRWFRSIPLDIFLRARETRFDRSNLFTTYRNRRDDLPRNRRVKCRTKFRQLRVDRSARTLIGISAPPTLLGTAKRFTGTGGLALRAEFHDLRLEEFWRTLFE